MDSSDGAKRRKLDNSVDISEISTHDSSISCLPKELLSAIIDYVPKTQWSSLELVNRSFRDAVYSSWQSMKEFDIEKDVFGIRQSVRVSRLSHFLISILAKLLRRSPMLTSIIGFPSIYGHNRLAILRSIHEFPNLRRIDFGSCGLKSEELVKFLIWSASRDRLVEIKLSADYQQINQNWPAIFTGREYYSKSRSSRLKLEKLSLKNEWNVFLDPKIIDLIDLSSLTVLVLDKIAAPSDYLLSLITNCNQLQQLQFSFMAKCRCKVTPCVHLDSSKRILETVSVMERLESLKISLINNGSNFYDNKHYLDIKGDLPILIDHLGQRRRLVQFGLLHENYCSVRVIEEIGKHLVGLKSLELFTWYCRPATLVNTIKKMVSLEKLTLSGSSVGEWNRAITPMVLDAVATYLQNLKIFHLWQAIHIDECLHVLTRMERLEELTIVGAHCHKINWESAFGHQLQSLELRNCGREFVASVMKHVPGLRRLVLSESFHLSNIILRMIPTSCPRLREFYLYPSWADAKKGVKAIIDGCPELQQLRY